MPSIILLSGLEGAVWHRWPNKKATWRIMDSCENNELLKNKLFWGNTWCDSLFTSLKNISGYDSLLTARSLQSWSHECAKHVQMVLQSHTYMQNHWQRRKAVGRPATTDSNVTWVEIWCKKIHDCQTAAATCVPVRQQIALTEKKLHTKREHWNWIKWCDCNDDGSK